MRDGPTKTKYHKIHVYVHVLHMYKFSVYMYVRGSKWALGQLYICMLIIYEMYLRKYMYIHICNTEIQVQSSVLTNKINALNINTAGVHVAACSRSESTGSTPWPTMPEACQYCGTAVTIIPRDQRSSWAPALGEDTWQCHTYPHTHAVHYIIIMHGHWWLIRGIQLYNTHEHARHSGIWRKIMVHCSRFVLYLRVWNYKL